MGKKRFSESSLFDKTRNALSWHINGCGLGCLRLLYLFTTGGFSSLFQNSRDCLPNTRKVPPAIADVPPYVQQYDHESKAGRKKFVDAVSIAVRRII